VQSFAEASGGFRAQLRVELRAELRAELRTEPPHAEPSYVEFRAELYVVRGCVTSSGLVKYLY
jgi:hypothetical protein